MGTVTIKKSCTILINNNTDYYERVEFRLTDATIISGPDFDVQTPLGNGEVWDTWKVMLNMNSPGNSGNYVLDTPIRAIPNPLAWGVEVEFYDVNNPNGLSVKNTNHKPEQPYNSNKPCK